MAQTTPNEINVDSPREKKYQTFEIFGMLHRHAPYSWQCL